MTERPSLKPTRETGHGLVNEVATLAREKYVQAVAGGIWAVNTAYNRFVEGQGLIRSALHGVTNAANTPLYSPKFDGTVGELIGATSQASMYFVGVGVAVGATAGVLDRRTAQREGRSAVKRAGSVILADCDGIPVYVDLGEQLRAVRHKNVVPHFWVTGCDAGEVTKT